MSEQKTFTVTLTVSSCEDCPFCDEEWTGECREVNGDTPPLDSSPTQGVTHGQELHL